MKALKYIFITALAISAFSCRANSPAAESTENTDASIQWLTFEEAVQKVNSDKNPKNILIDFYTDWCGWCKVMDKKTYTDPHVIKLINKYFYPVKFDAETKETIHFMGQDFGFVKHGRTGYNQLAAEFLQGQLSYPTTLFLNPKFQIITPIAGFVKPEELEPILNFLGQNLYLNDTSGKAWEQYKNNYKRGQ